MSTEQQVERGERETVRPNLAFKFLCYDGERITSHHDGSEWVVGQWREVPAPEEECVGLCCSPHAVQAWLYVPGKVVALVEYGGKVIGSGDKLTCQRIRLVKVWTREQYDAVQRRTREQYEAVRRQAREQYEAIAPPWKQDDVAAKREAWAQYHAIERPAWEQYEADVDAALLALPPMMEADDE